MREKKKGDELRKKQVTPNQIQWFHMRFGAQPTRSIAFKTNILMHPQ